MRKRVTRSYYGSNQIGGQGAVRCLQSVAPAGDRLNLYGQANKGQVFEGVVRVLMIAGEGFE